MKREKKRRVWKRPKIISKKKLSPTLGNCGLSDVSCANEEQGIQS